jgi:hypothetical protein
MTAWNQPAPYSVSVNEHLRIMATVSVALLLLAVGSATAAGQDGSALTGNRSSAGTPIYFTVGLGTGTKAIAGQLGASLTVPAGQITARWSGVSDFNLLGRNSSANDVALLYGLRRINGATWYGIAGGPSLAWFAEDGECLSYIGLWPIVTCSQYVVERQRTQGLALQGAIGWRFVSVSALGDVNRVQSFAAITANLHIGKMR